MVWKIGINDNDARISTLVCEVMCENLNFINNK